MSAAQTCAEHGHNIAGGVILAVMFVTSLALFAFLSWLDR